MMRTLKLCVALAAMLSITFLGDISPAHAAKRIEWKHLLPKLPPLANPLAKLTEDQRFDIETIQWARGLTAKQKRLEENQQGVQDVRDYERQFKKAGLNVDQLLSKYQTWRTAVAKRNKIVNSELSGQSITLAGYLLPLEFSDKGVTDFLLVPYVGACIHVPPPPANQIVFVRLAKKFKVEDLFTAVWVKGKLKTKATSKALALVDGTSDVSVGYHIDGGSAVIYRE
jgi:hypothetical protein